MHTGLRIRTFIFALFFFVAAMSGMLYYADHKAITITNVAQAQVTDGEQTAGMPGTDGKGSMLRFRQGEENTSYLCIPLEEGVKAENVSMENHYMEREMWIYIAGTSIDYYATEAVYGNISHIEAGSYEYAHNTVLLKFQLSDVYECKSILEENCLYIEFVPPREMYDKIVVIDAGGGGEDYGCYNEELIEKEITLDIVKRLKLMLEDTDIKVYYTRTEDVNLSAESRVGLANAVRADMLISIRLNESEDTSLYGTETLYNENYFIPGFGSVELADLVERNVVTSINGKGNGLFAAEETDVLLQEARVPVAALRAGYISNRQEAQLLAREDYRERIAKGLYEAITKAFE